MTGPGRAGPRGGRWWRGVALAAGAAIVTALTVGVLMAPAGPEMPAEAPSSEQGGLDGIAADAMTTLGLDSGRFLGLRRELQAAFERRRDQLPPEASSSVDESLALLDRNIAELSAALERDPGNPELARLLASAYRRQVEMLRTVDRLGTAVGRGDPAHGKNDPDPDAGDAG